MPVGVQETLTDEMVGDAGEVLLSPLLPLLQPAKHNNPRNDRARKVLHIIRASMRHIVRGEISGQL